MPKPKIWGVKRITTDEDAETGLRIVNLPTVKGLTNADRDALFAFEREHLNTTRAVIRMNKRAEAGAAAVALPLPYRLSAAGLPEGVIAAQLTAEAERFAASE